MCQYEYHMNILSWIEMFLELCGTHITVVTVGKTETEGGYDRARCQNDLRSYNARSCTKA